MNDNQIFAELLLGTMILEAHRLETAEAIYYTEIRSGGRRREPRKLADAALAARDAARSMILAAQDARDEDLYVAAMDKALGWGLRAAICAIN